ncbi:MAG: LytTR family DNA-binding domain-containing protein [Bacteroidota bacterium]
MKKRLIRHALYWLVVLLFLTLFFGQNWENPLLAFYFSSLLLPIVIGTTYFFNSYLVPRYLFTGKHVAFALYLGYMIVISLYLEMLVVIFSFVVIANYKMETMSIMSSSILILGMTLYLIVFITSFIRLVVQIRKKTQQIESLQHDKQRNKKSVLTIRSNRKNHQLPLQELLYIESLDDHVKVVMSGTELIVREKITRLALRLPDQFMRIHRSFVINEEKIGAFTTTHVVVQKTSLPIGRTYKKEVLSKLKRRDQKRAPETGMGVSI